MRILSSSSNICGAAGGIEPLTYYYESVALLIKLILIRLAVTLVAYCVTKCQEESIRLKHI